MQMISPIRFPSRTRLLLAAAFLVTLTSGAALSTRATEPTDVETSGLTPGGPSTRLGEQTQEFIAALDAEQAGKALYAFDDDERFDLRLAPLGLEGLKISEMSPAQWSELEAILAQILSPTGLEKMNTIRSLEREVAETEGGLFGFFTKRLRDANRYFLTVYGTPEAGEAYGARFDGHHLSLNWTEIPGAPLSATPLFFGGQPRVVPDGLERAGLRVLADEETVAVDLLNGLSPEFRGRARMALKKGSSIRRPMSIAGEVPIELSDAIGIQRRELGPDLRRQFDALVDLHLGSFASEVAARYRAQLLESGKPVHLAFASAGGEAEPVASGRALYYRIQGAGLLIEFDNTSEAADHIHVVIRDAEGDFGRDVLSEHLTALHAVD